MAKKKNTVKSALNSLRQALTVIKTATVRFSADHVIAIGYNPTTKETIVSDIPQNLTSSFILGEGGGGSDVNVHSIDVTYVNTSETYQKTLENMIIIEDNEILGATRNLDPSGTAMFKTLTLLVNNKYGAQVVYNPGGTDVISNAVNCSYDSDLRMMVITDPTQPASCTISVTGTR